MDQTYKISGMQCGKCTKRVSAALAPFAERVDVTLTPQRAILTNPREINIAVLNAAIGKVGGYTLAPVGQATVAQPSPPPLPAPQVERSTFDVYYPLLLIAAYIAVAACAGTIQSGAFDWQAWMTNFMAGFFLVFSAFKFLDLEGFAGAYASYDLLAKRWHGWGLIYPFLELGLGLAYLFRFAPTATYAATIALMGFSSLGVMQALSEKRVIQCACLGTVLNLPMSTITLVEDLAMVAMAGAMLLGAGHN